jgi:SAM-dependent methyltransferase
VSYVMDHAGEAERVHRKTDQDLTRQQLSWVGVAPGMAVVDVGCAGGTTCAILSEMVGPSGRVVGVDASAERIRAAASLGNTSPVVEYVVADAADTRLRDGSFDIAWSRFLFEYLDDWSGVLAEMRRIVKPGGVIAISDVDGNCIWHDGMCPSLAHRMERVIQTLGRGFDPHAGRLLYGACLRIGLCDVRVDIRPYHQIVGRIAPEAEAHWKRKMAGVASALTLRGWSPADACALADDFMEFLRDPQGLTHSVLFTVWGKTPTT